MTFWREGSLFLGLLIGCVVAAKGLSAGWFQLRKKQPPAVRMNPELLAQMRSEIVHNASKRVLRADFTRNR